MNILNFTRAWFDFFFYARRVIPPSQPKILGVSDNLGHECSIGMEKDQEWGTCFASNSDEREQIQMTIDKVLQPL